MNRMFLARYSHFEKILCKAGQNMTPNIKWLSSSQEVSPIGIAGNTGLSDGRHVHIDVVEVPYDPDYTYKKYTQDQIYAGNPPANKQELDYFMDEDLFRCPLRITTQFNETAYYLKYGRRHPAYDAVALKTGDWTVYWNRSFTGRVIYTGYDTAYGNTVVIAYTLNRFNKYIELGGTPVYTTPINELIEKQMPEIRGTLYRMKNESPVKSVWGQSPLHNRNIRYIKIHPDNFGIIDSPNTIEKTGFSGMNGTFFSKEATGRLFATSILMFNEKILRFHAEHYNDFRCPQSVLCRYKNGAFGIEKINTAQDLFVDRNMNNKSRVLWAVGGIGLVGGTGYNPESEGFKAGINVVTGKYQDFRDVLRVTNHTSVGVDKNGFVILARSYQTSRAFTVEHMKSLGCVLAIGEDSGGSTQYATPTDKRLSTRATANQLVAIDLKL